MGAINSIDESIRGKEHFAKKAKRNEGKIVDEIKEEDEAKDKLQIIYEDIIKILKKYIDMREDYYSLVAVWVIGTYFHKDFETYPYLFINAMRGSAKTRLLKLIACLSKKGEVLASLREAVLFRTAKGRTICIDEFERIGSKEKADLRELLNAAYKKGIKVKRMKKKKMPDPETGRINEEQVVEEFDVFCPIALANIWGMEEVLGDRCIQLTLEKSAEKRIIKLVENFEHDKNINDTKIFLNSLVNGVVSPFWMPRGVYTEWNKFIIDTYTPNDTTTPFFDILTTQMTQQHTINDTTDTYNINNKNNTTTPFIIPLFEKIDKANINGRNLELFFPLFIISNNISERLLCDSIKIAKTITEERRMEELVESRDIALIDFISQQEDTGEFVEIMGITSNFKEYLKESEEEIKWINTQWIGRALKRLNLIKKKRRLRKGREVILNIEKAKKKILMFKQDEKIEDKQEKIEDATERI